MRRLALAAGLVLSALACARMGQPPGGPEDRIPPQVVATTPDTFATVDGPYREAVVFRFNERISERPTQGELSDAVIVSPRTGQVEVEHSRESLEVSIIGGFRDSVVYRLTLRPVIRDMFQNSMLDAFELVFSTGAPIEPYVLAGRVTDRITGDAVEGARVNAVLRDPRPDTLIHTAVTDTGGVYAMRYIPPGIYRVTAFEDTNRNFEVDGFEPRGEELDGVDPPADTAVVEIALLEPDTTPARVVSVEVADSATLAIETDDHLDPTSPFLRDVTVEIALGEETDTVAPVPGVDSLFHTHEWERRAELVDSLARVRQDSLARARADSLTTVADSLLASGDSAAADSVRTLAEQAAPAEAGGGGGQQDRQAREEEPRAEQTFYALLDRPLPVEVPYRVTVEGIVNINGVAGGGGEETVVRLPPPDTAAPDTAAADTTGAPADTGATVPDTTGAAPDTTGAEPDTAEARPDTTGAQDPPRRRDPRARIRRREAGGA